MRANSTCYAIAGMELIRSGTGTISEKGTELLKSYENLGEEYKIYEGGKLVAILSRDVEGEGNITYGDGWENRIQDELELFFDGDGNREH